MVEKRTATSVFEKVKQAVEAKIPIAKEQWLELAFDLVVLRLEEARLFNKMRQEVAQRKVELYRAQDKKNVAAVEMEIESSEPYRLMKDQEDLLYSVDELVRVSKKNADLNL